MNTKIVAKDKDTIEITTEGYADSASPDMWNIALSETGNRTIISWIEHTDKPGVYTINVRKSEVAIETYEKDYRYDSDLISDENAHFYYCEGQGEHKDAEQIAQEMMKVIEHAVKVTA